MTAPLKLVPSSPEQPTPEHLLRKLIPERDRLVAMLARVDAMIADQGRALAKDRGVAFIRIEHLRREFGL